MPQDEDAKLLRELEAGTFRLTLTDNRGNVVDVDFPPFTLAGLDQFSLVGDLVNAVKVAAQKASAAPDTDDRPPW